MFKDILLGLEFTIDKNNLQKTTLQKIMFQFYKLFGFERKQEGYIIFGPFWCYLSLPYYTENMILWVKNIFQVTRYKLYKNVRHYFHLVTPSPWPLLSALICFNLMGGSILYFNNYKNGGIIVFFSWILLLSLMFVWWRDVKREGTFEGMHTKKVQLGLRIGMLLFILSEIMLFFSFFWAFFHSSLSPVIEIGAIWPPKEIQCFNYTEVPFLNTLLLLTSGAAVTWAHYGLLSFDHLFLEIRSKIKLKEIFIKYLEKFTYFFYNSVGDKKESLSGLSFTLILACLFTVCQGIEYFESDFSFNDGIYGSTFFLTTGFHGFHVIVGTLFLGVCLGRIILNHLSVQHHFGFEAASWYWHFVDIVWLFLYGSMYIWGSIF